MVEEAWTKIPAEDEVGVKAVPFKILFHWEGVPPPLSVPQYTAPVVEVLRSQLNMEEVVAKDRAVVVTPLVA
jgi:hypothetical protein